MAYMGQTFYMTRIDHVLRVVRIFGPISVRQIECRLPLADAEVLGTRLAVLESTGLVRLVGPANAADAIYDVTPAGRKQFDRQEQARGKAGECRGK